MCQGKREPAARDGQVTGRLSSGTFQVNVPGVGAVTAQDRTGRAARGQSVTLVRVQGGAWRIV